ncbi:MAG: hypothetical protein NVS4B5_03830 [Vulcanimicrobiaceae bacterium]
MKTIAVMTGRVIAKRVNHTAELLEASDGVRPLDDGTCRSTVAARIPQKKSDRSIAGSVASGASHAWLSPRTPSGRDYGLALAAAAGTVVLEPGPPAAEPIFAPMPSAPDLHIETAVVFPGASAVALPAADDDGDAAADDEEGDVPVDVAAAADDDAGAAGTVIDDALLVALVGPPAVLELMLGGGVEIAVVEPVPATPAGPAPTLLAEPVVLAGAVAPAASFMPADPVAPAIDGALPVVASVPVVADVLPMLDAPLGAGTAASITNVFSFVLTKTFGSPGEQRAFIPAPCPTPFIMPPPAGSAATAAPLTARPIPRLKAATSFNFMLSGMPRDGSSPRIHAEQSTDHASRDRRVGM